ncbi:hypothetical protein [Fodinicola acaciae]|uniref:hypothetical protein n=1 Tax=Fodinicola acaciae TaxID=2681555 RepID=UPI0013D866D3|nr:hypothetical protein [Fodinicola acaciae]
MSSLEAASRPVMLALMDSTRAATPVAITADDAATLARWTTKTAMTSELASLRDEKNEEPWISADLREALMTASSPLANSRVWLATYAPGEVCKLMQSVVTYDPIQGGGQRQAFASCLMLNGVAFLTYIFRPGDRFNPLPPLQRFHGLLLWPTLTPVEYPPLPCKESELFNAITNWSPWLSIYNKQQLAPPTNTSTGEMKRQGHST